MGETEHRHVHIHALDPDQLGVIVGAVDRFAKALVGALTPAGAQAATPEPAPELDRWQFYDPRIGEIVEAYLDPQNQVRHVPMSRTSEIPKTWRRILLGPEQQ